MKNRDKFYAVLLMLICSVHASFGQVLDKSVSIQFQNIPLEQALKKIKTTCGVNFSYSPDQIDVTKPVTLNVSNVTLNQALAKLFKDAPVSYRAVGNQIVLKKGKAAPFNTQPTSATKAIVAKTIVKTDTAITLVPAVDTIPDKLKLKAKPLEEVIAADSAKAAETLDYSYEKELIGLNSGYEYKKDSLKKDFAAYKLKLKENWKSAKYVLGTEYQQLKDSLKANKKSTQLVNDTSYTKGGISDELLPSRGQLTFTYPIGTHGSNSGLYRNKYSGNLLVGYNGALQGIEFGGFGNINRKEVHGAQFAGITNITGEYVRGAQFAGICNITREEVIGAQFAGVVNITKGDIAGVQAAGLVNVSSGAQIDGVQMAPVNEHTGTINGGQIGLVNHARNVNGFQLGFINICDTIKGMPIGLISIAKNGYHRAEAYYSETTQVTTLFKTGVKSFYNIFQLGGNFSSDQYRWTFGYGLGSAVQMSKGSAIAFDLLAIHINENEAFTNKINEQLQLRVMVSMNLARNLDLFAGPTFNAGFSEFPNGVSEVGSTMIPKKTTVYEHTIKMDNGKNIYNPFWIGVNAGLRF